MFSWPNGGLAPANRPELVSSIDLFPTVLAAAGARCPNGMPGVNLLENLQKKHPIKRQGIFGESFAHDIANLKKPEASLLFRWRIEGKWKLLLTYDGEVNRYQSTHPRTEKRPQLFDLSRDPHEKTNLALKHPEVVAKMAAKINAWWLVKERKAITKFN